MIATSVLPDSCRHRYAVSGAHAIQQHSDLPGRSIDTRRPLLADVRIGPHCRAAPSRRARCRRHFAGPPRRDTLRDPVRELWRQVGRGDTNKIAWRARTVEPLDRNEIESERAGMSNGKAVSLQLAGQRASQTPGLVDVRVSHG